MKKALKKSAAFLCAAATLCGSMLPTLPEGLQLLNTLSASASSSVEYEYDAETETLTVTGGYVVDLDDAISINHAKHLKFSDGYILQYTESQKWIDDDHNMQVFDGWGSCSLETVDMSNVDMMYVLSCKNMFKGCENLKSVNMNNTGNIAATPTSCYGMFYGCTSLENVDISNLHTYGTTTFQEMFYRCSNLTTLNLFETKTNKAADMYRMFSGCEKLESISTDNFYTGKVTNMAEMFSGCLALQYLDLTKFDTSNVITMQGMFSLCQSLTDLDLSSFDTSVLRNAKEMFFGCINLERIYVGTDWTMENLQVTPTDYTTDLFLRCPKLVGMKGTKYSSNATNADYAHVDGGINNPGYLWMFPTDEYPITIAGQNLTDVLADDLYGDGTVSYNPETKTLTLDGAEIIVNDEAFGYSAISSDVEGLTIYVASDSELYAVESAIALRGNTVITGPGKLTASAVCRMDGSLDGLGIIIGEGNLTIEDADVTAYGLAGIFYNAEQNTGDLNIVNSNVSASGTQMAIGFFDKVTMDGCEVLSPAGAVYTEYMDKYGNKFNTFMDATGGLVNEISIGQPSLEITADPQDVTAVIGATAKFSVTAEGGSDISYQWQYFDGEWHDTSLTGAKTATLSVPVKAARNGLKYRCVVTSGNQSVTSAEAALFVKTKITAQPTAISAAVGDTAKFSVTATGAGLTYQWQYYDGTWHNTSMTGAKTAELSVPVIAGRNGLKYRCVITDANSTVTKSNAVKLTVLPTITTQPKAASGAVGETVKFTVKATGAGLTYQWQYYDGEWHDTTLTGAQTAALSVAVKAGRNGLKYRCVITDANKAVVKSNAVKLTVNTAITAQPKDASGYVGDTAKFSVTATGAGLTYQWQYYDTEWHNTSMTGAKTATLSVPVIAGRNGLKYRCIITDANGAAVKSNAVKLTVLPTITAQPKAVTTTAGSTAKFTVTATGAGLTYQWQYYNPKTDTWADTTLTGAKTATLSVGATTGRNGLSYHCVITDANGKTLTSDAALLTVK